MPICLKHFNEIERERVLPNSFLEASITLMAKVDKNLTGKKSTGQFPY